MLDQPGGKHYTEVSFKEASQQTKLKWEEEIDGPERDEVRRKTPSLPHPDLHEALQDLSAFFCDVLEYPESWQEKWEVCGVKVKYKGGVPEVAVTAKREIHTGDSVSQTTPYIPPSEGAPEALGRIFHEAERHIEGKRNQGDLFLSPGNRPGGNGAAQRARA